MQQLPKCDQCAKPCANLIYLRLGSEALGEICDSCATATREAIVQRRTPEAAQYYVALTSAFGG
jgi:hypothetical protein